MERKNVITLKGNPVTLVGEEVRAGQKANDFKALAHDMTDKRLSDFKGKIKIIPVGVFKTEGPLVVNKSVNHFLNCREV